MDLATTVVLRKTATINRAVSQTTSCDRHNFQSYARYLQDCCSQDQAPGSHLGVQVTAEAVKVQRKLTYLSRKQK